MCASRTTQRRILIAAVLLLSFVTALVATGCASLPPNTVEVKMINLQFVPQTVTVPVGTTVRWVNQDQTAHMPMSDNFDPTKTVAGAFSSKPLSPGDTFDFTFKTPGTYKYHCNIHGYMTGTVIVQ